MSLQYNCVKQCLSALPANELRTLRTDIVETLYARLRTKLYDADVENSFTKEIAAIEWISRMLDANNKELIKYVGSIKIDDLVEQYTTIPRRAIENHTIQLIVCQKNAPMYINIHHINRIVQVNWDSTGVLVREGVITTHGNPRQIPYIMFILRNLLALIEMCP